MLYRTHSKLTQVEGESIKLKFDNINLNKRLSTKGSFSENMEFLIFIINNKVNKYLNIKIQSEILKNDTGVLTDKTFSKHIEECTYNILTSINLDQCAILCNYFTYTGLLEYIAEEVYVKVFTFYSKNNLPKFTSANSEAFEATKKKIIKEYTEK